MAIDIKALMSDVYSSILCQSFFGLNSQVLLWPVQRIEQIALEDGLPHPSSRFVDRSRRGMLDDLLHPNGPIDVWPL